MSWQFQSFLLLLFCFCIVLVVVLGCLFVCLLCQGLLYPPGWSELTGIPPGSASVLRLKACAAMLSLLCFETGSCYIALVSLVLSFPVLGLQLDITGGTTGFVNTDSTWVVFSPVKVTGSSPASRSHYRCPSQTDSHSAGLNLSIPLPQPSEFWHDQCYSIITGWTHHTRYCSNLTHYVYTVF